MVRAASDNSGLAPYKFRLLLGELSLGLPSLSAVPPMEGRAGAEAEDRLDDAITDFASWRRRLKSFWVAVSIVLGIGAAIPGFGWATDIQLALWKVAFVIISVPGAVVVCILVVIIGAMLSRLFVRARTPAAVQRIAARHEIDPSQLSEIAELVA